MKRWTSLSGVGLQIPRMLPGGSARQSRALSLTSKNDSHPRAHDRNHQQIDSHFAGFGAGIGSGAYREEIAKKMDIPYRRYERF